MKGRRRSNSAPFLFSDDPATGAKVTDRVWEIGDSVKVVEDWEARAVTEIRQLRMRRSLRESVGSLIWPDGVHLETFSESRAAEVHALLELAYAGGGGAVDAFEEWWSSLSTDSEYSPDLCFPAYASEGAIVAIAQCWTSAFIKDLAVHPGWRRRGIGRALLLHVFHVFQERGALAVDLKVQTENPSGAVQFYKSLGMFQISD